PVRFAAELSIADANRLSDLLARNTLRGTLMELDHLAAAGPEAITINISYPMLYRPFHRDWSEYARYVAFYKAVVAAARQRGLKVIVTSGARLGRGQPSVAAFSQPVPSLDAYKAGRLAVARTIAREIGPDYLTVQAEPDVEATQTGQPVGTADGAYDLVSDL